MTSFAIQSRKSFKNVYVFNKQFLIHLSLHFEKDVLRLLRYHVYTKSCHAENFALNILHREKLSQASDVFREIL